MHDLYNCRIGNFERPIPFFTCEDWQFFQEISSDHNCILEYSESEKPKFVVNEKLISRRQKLGQKPFNEPILYIDYYIEKSADKIKLHVKSCDYFEAMTYLMELEEVNMSTNRTYKLV